MFEEQMDLDEDKKEDKKEGRKIFQTAALVFVVFVIGAALYYFLIYKRPAKTAETAEAPAAVTEKGILPPVQTDVPQIPPVALDKSDELVRQLAAELSAHPRLAVWLGSEQLIRRFVAAVDNIANGLSPRPHISFFMPDAEYKTIKRGDLLVADPDGYNRYNPVVDVFVSLDSKKCVSLFRGFKPLLQEAYRDLGYPDEDFEQTMLKAISELLRAPVVDGTILVEKTVISYKMLDPKLENLSEAQKHLLRMGPENVEAIQKKLREMALALGAAESGLPPPRYYTPPAGLL
jgi:hypothetical protein